MGDIIGQGADSRSQSVGIDGVYVGGLILQSYVLVCHAHFFSLLVIHSEVREQTLKRISNIKDRDEREEQITGRASERVYISTFAFLIMLLFLSVFHVNVSQIPIEEQVAGKTKTLSIRMGFEIFDEPEIKSSVDGEVIFEAKDIPLSKSSIILLVLGWLIVSYNLNVRRELNP